jgi:hypothetical protein
LRISMSSVPGSRSAVFPTVGGLLVRLGIYQTLS